jgi:uncharacterized membrane protein (DUF2068 family)
MSRSRNILTGAVFAALLSLANFITALILLPRGSADLASDGNQPPYAIVVLEVIVGAIGLVGAYGAFRSQRWGILLTLIVMAVNVLASVPGIAFAPTFLSQASSAIATVVSGIVIWLLLRRDARKPALADVHR